MGSVKDLKIIKPARADQCGEGIFTFSDRYSVFDWGEMPDLIDEKGKALCILSAYFLEKLEKTNIKTHYIGVVDENNEVKKLNDLEKPTNQLKIKLVNVINPALDNKIYDYSVFNTAVHNFLIPFEIIYRNSLPAGSSVFKRLETGQTTPEELGLPQFPQPGQILQKPIYDVSTKLEVNDRYISWEEAKQMANLTDQELNRIKEITQVVNELITYEFKRIELINEDGKIELAFDPQREIILVDTLGTLDECRFKYHDYPISKEIARMYYRKTDWYTKVEEAKKQDRFSWKKIVNEEPQPLPTEFKNLFANMYKAVANQITNKEIFKNVPYLDKIMAGMKKYI